MGRAAFGPGAGGEYGGKGMSKKVSEMTPEEREKARKRATAYREKNRERIREYQRKYNAENPERKKAWKEKYASTHENQIKEAARKASKKRREEHPEKVRESLKRYRESHPEETRKSFREWRKKAFESNNQYKIRFFLRTQLCRLAKSTSTRKSYLTGCTPLELRTYLESLFLPGMTWGNYGEWQIDHIKPCVLFDLSDLEQRKQCFRYTNLQPLWAIDNIKKGAKYGEPA
jgi:hypothetical protein